MKTTISVLRIAACILQGFVVFGGYEPNGKVLLYSFIALFLWGSIVIEDFNRTSIS